MLKDFIFPAVVSVFAFLVCDVVLKRWLIEPRARYQVLKERAAYCLSFYKPYYTRPYKIEDSTAITDKGKRYLQAKEDLRDCAAQLRGFSEVYPRFAPRVILGIPAKGDIASASDKLLYLSSITIDDVWSRLEEKYANTPNKEITDAMSGAKKLLGINNE